MINIFKVIRETGKHAAIGFTLVTMVTGLTVHMITPQTAMSADVLGGEIGVVQPEVADQELQDVQDIEEPEVGVMDVADGADLTLIVPLQIENLHVNVDRGKIICNIRRWVGQGEEMTGITGETRTFDIEEGAYSNTFHFYFSKPADLDVDNEYGYGYYCSVALNDSTTGDSYRSVWTTQTADDILEDAPPWAVVSPESNIVASGVLDW